MSEINQTESEKLVTLLQENLKSSAEVLKIVSDIKKYMRWQQIWSLLRFVLIIIPIIFGFIYLPPLIREVFQSYKGLFQ